MQRNRKILITGATGNIGHAAMTLFEELENWDCLGVARTIPMVNNMQTLNLNRSWNVLKLWCHSLLDIKFDIVLMAHGVQKAATLKDMTEDDWLNIVYGNLSSAIGLTQALVKEDKLNDGALLVYCSSIQARTPRMGRGLYAASKAGLEAFSRTVAAELAPRGIRSVALRLGQLTNTMYGVVFTEQEKDALQQRALLPWVNPVDVAKFIEDLYYQKSITGCVIDFDSGHGINVW